MTWRKIFIFTYILFGGLSFLSSSQAQAQVSRVGGKLIEVLTREGHNLTFLRHQGITESSAGQITESLSLSWRALSGSDEFAPTPRQLHRVLRTLNLSDPHDIQTKNRLQQLLNRPADQITQTELTTAINDFIYLASRYGNNGLFLACRACTNSSLSQMGIRFTLKSVNDASTQNILENILPRDPLGLNSYVSSRMRRMELGSFAQAPIHLVAPQEQRSLALFLAMAEYGSSKQKDFVHAVFEFSRRPNGDIALLDANNPHRFWSLLSRDLSEEALEEWTLILREVSDIASEQVKKEDVFYDYMLRRVESDQTGEILSKILFAYNHLFENFQLPAQRSFAQNLRHLKVLAHSRLTDSARIVRAFETLDINISRLTAIQRQQLKDGLIDAHNVGAARGAGIYEYTFSEIKRKRQILLNSGYNDDQANYLIRSGLAGRPPTREIVERPQLELAHFFEQLTRRPHNEVRKEVLNLYESSRAPHGFLNKAIGYLSSSRPPSTSRFSELLDALLFVDYQHSSQQLIELSLKGRRTLGSLSYHNEYGGREFKNFIQARNILNNERPEINLDTLKLIHRNIMKDGVEDVKKSDLGIIRRGKWHGNVTRLNPINSETRDIINSNPYLRFDQTGETERGFIGKILYPLPENIKPEALSRLERTHPEVFSEINEFQRLKKDIDEAKERLSRFISQSENDPEQIARIQESIRQLEQEYSNYVRNIDDYNQKLAQALTEERFEWFAHQRASLGDLDSAEKLDEYVNLLADFQRDLISIHPMSNGNGRSTRMLLLDYALTKEGLPPATLIDPNLDIYATATQWRESIRNGILSTSRRYQDIHERLIHGLPIEHSVEMLTPHSPPVVVLEARRQGSSVFREIEGVEHMDPRVYRELVKIEFESDPNLMRRVKDNPLQTWESIDQRVVETFKRNNLHYRHRKFGDERVELGIVDDDFRHMFGHSTYDDPDKYQFKMRNWYDDTIVWRGLANRNREKTETEIIEMFKSLNLHMASNSVVKKAPSNSSPDKVKSLALEDFDSYNKDIFSDRLVEMARDHSETGPLYASSYGYSTSKNRDVGKAFAMGAMVVAEYGQHQQYQHLLKSRVLVGARKAHKDVDLTRLKQVRDDFSYSYGRQQEVMGIGAADPDSIVVVQTIDDQGEVITSYLRNQENPGEILVVRGEINPGERPSNDDIIKSINL